MCVCVYIYTHTHAYAYHNQIAKNLKPWPSLVGQVVKNLPTMQEIWVRSQGWEDPLEKGKVIHSSWPGEFHGPYSP